MNNTLRDMGLEKFRKLLRGTTATAQHFAPMDMLLRAILECAADIAIAGNVEKPELLFKECLEDVRRDRRRTYESED